MKLKCNRDWPTGLPAVLRTVHFGAQYQTRWQSVPPRDRRHTIWGLLETAKRNVMSVVWWYIRATSMWVLVLVRASRDLSGVCRLTHQPQQADHSSSSSSGTAGAAEDNECPRDNVGSASGAMVLVRRMESVAEGRPVRAGAVYYFRCSTFLYLQQSDSCVPYHTSGATPLPNPYTNTTETNDVLSSATVGLHADPKRREVRQGVNARNFDFF